jgi:arachidonate 15-lipoxygenase
MSDRKLARESVRSWHIFNSMLPDDVKSRGMEAIPHYPYRDDGMRVWHATNKFATALVDAIYNGSDGAVAGDEPLQRWAASIASPKGGNIHSMPNALQTRAELARVLTSVIFTCGPQHSAVNFTQHDYGSFVLSMPLAGRKAYHDLVDRDPKNPISEKELLRFLPNLEMTRCALLISTLTTFFTTHSRLSPFSLSVLVF